MNTIVNPATPLIANAARYLDQVFAQWLVDNFAREYSAEKQDALRRLAMAVSYSVHLKHTCLDMVALTQLGDKELSAMLAGIDASLVKQLLTDQITPLVCSADGQQIWLQKYHYFDLQCAKKLLAMALHSLPVADDDQQRLDAMFPQPSEQKSAAKKALQQQLAVITGGPGTGKTFTVARIIALLLHADPHCNIVLAAPTGKAAQRMKAALDEAMQDNVLAGYAHLLEKLPAKASTLHSLLGIGFASPKPRKHHLDPLQLDVLIIDEASMIDLPMMYRLLDALPVHARLIMLGDKDQLASVEAGSVLGELCQSRALAACMGNISFSRRFADDSEIGQLAKWLNDSAAFVFPDMSRNTSVHYHVSSKDQPWQPAWLPLALAKYQAIQASVASHAAIIDVLDQQKAFQLLCALREGPYGVNGINSIIERALMGKDALLKSSSAKGKAWYAGMPVMVVQNDNERKLYNGDVGMVLPLNHEGTAIDIHSKQLKACFHTGEGFKAISLAQMPPYETCYAITVHKSQGSEYEHVLIVLPADSSSVQDNPVLARELAYTAVTRAKKQVDIYAGAGVLEIMAQRQTVRMSGLALMLDNRR